MNGNWSDVRKPSPEVFIFKLPILFELLVVIIREVVDPAPPCALPLPFSLQDILQIGDNVGAADKAAIQLVEVQPYQLLVSDT